jgi:hypothetical protein
LATGRTFRSKAAAGRYFDMSNGTVTNRIREGSFAEISWKELADKRAQSMAMVKAKAEKRKMK